MDATEFITLSFTLSCTLGPALGFALAVVVFVLEQTGGGSFTLTIGRRARPRRAGSARPGSSAPRTSYS